MPRPKEREGGCGKIKAAQDQEELQATDAALNEHGPPNHGVADAATPEADETTAVCTEDPHQQPEMLEGASGPAFCSGDDQHFAFDSMDEGEEDTKTCEAANGSQEESGKEPKEARGSYSTLVNVGKAIRSCPATSGQLPQRRTKSSVVHKRTCFLFNNITQACLVRLDSFLR